jgi:ABC-type multidrug transport system ATPase subunit
VIGPTSEVGWVPQQPAQYSKLSVSENLRLFARLERLEYPEDAVGRMFEQTGLEDRADESVRGVAAAFAAARCGNVTPCRRSGTR